MPDDPVPHAMRGYPIEEPVTRLQGQYLAFIREYTKIHGRAPAEADVQRYFRVTPPAVHDMLKRMERAGLIARQPGVARSIRVLLPDSEVPRPE